MASDYVRDRTYNAVAQDVSHIIERARETGAVKVEVQAKDWTVTVVWPSGLSENGESSQ